MSLSLKNVSHRFGNVDAVVDADLDVAPGEIMCLFGPSGCGKTTLLRIAAGLETVQEGAVFLDGEKIARPGAEIPPEKRPIGFVFQDFVLFPHMTVEKNIAFGCSGRGAKALIAEQLQAMQLDGLAGRFPHELSGGQQQRVALARALVRQPKALLLDEPFAAIDATLRRRLREDLRRVLKAQNVAVVLVTHDPEEALALGDRIALMRHGRIVETATPEALFTVPETLEGAKIFPASQVLTGQVRNSEIHTALGGFPAPNLSDGPGQLVLREGALRASSEQGPNDERGFEVVDCRFTGPGWAAYLSLGPDADLLRVSLGAFVPFGERVFLDIDLGKIFIFDNQ